MCVTGVRGERSRVSGIGAARSAATSAQTSEAMINERLEPSGADQMPGVESPLPLSRRVAAVEARAAAAEARAEAVAEELAALVARVAELEQQGAQAKQATPKRGRGRPRKPTQTGPNLDAASPPPAKQATPKRGRGRPRKATHAGQNLDAASPPPARAPGSQLVATTLASLAGDHHASLRNAARMSDEAFQSHKATRRSVPHRHPPQRTTPTIDRLTPIAGSAAVRPSTASLAYTPTDQTLRGGGSAS